MKHNLLTALYAVSLFLFVLSASIALPIVCRFFYGMLIGPLDIEAISGYTRAELLDGYNELLNYLTLGTPFGIGPIPCSERGAAHFADCRRLFLLDFAVIAVSLAVWIGLRIGEKKGAFVPRRCLGRSAFFWVGIALIAVPALLGGLAALDFERAFAIFHALFFPGKENWEFYPENDRFILMFPETFFIACGILIGVSIALWAIGLILSDLLPARRSFARRDKTDC